MKKHLSFYHRLIMVYGIYYIKILFIEFLKIRIRKLH